MSRDYTLRIKYRAGDHPFYNVGTKVFYGDDKAKLQRKLIELMCEYWVISYTIKCTPYSKSYFCEKCQIRKNKVHFLRNKKNCISCIEAIKIGQQMRKVMKEE